MCIRRDVQQRLIFCFKCFCQTKLESQQYQTPAEFAEDMRLICSNCYRYNPPDSGIVQLARRLQVGLFYHITEDLLSAVLCACANTFFNLYTTDLLSHCYMEIKGSRKPAPWA